MNVLVADVAHVVGRALKSVTVEQSAKAMKVSCDTSRYIIRSDLM